MLPAVLIPNHLGYTAVTGRLTQGITHTGKIAMKSIRIWWVGGITGSGTGLLFFLATFILSIDGELALPELGIALITPAIVAVLVARATNSKIVILLIVAYLTLVVPLIGPLFGAPDPDIMIVVTLAILGLVGGLVWSTPFVLWAYMRRGNAD